MHQIQLNEDPGNTKLFQDINSGELLFSPSSDPDTQTLLTNQDGSSSFADTSLIAVDIEQASDGTIQLLSYRGFEETETEFVITNFDSSGKLIQETTPLNKADQATYDAEKLFGIDLNDDDIQGRNIQEISKYDLADTYGWTIFEDDDSTHTAHSKVNSGSSNVIANAHSYDSDYEVPGGDPGYDPNYEVPGGDPGYDPIMKLETLDLILVMESLVIIFLLKIMY